MTPSARDPLPLLGLSDALVLPGSVISVEIDGPRNLAALAHLSAPGPGQAERVVVAPLAPLAPSVSEESDGDAPTTDDALPPVGTLARVLGRVQLSGGSLRVTLHGLERVGLGDPEERQGHLVVRPTPLGARPTSRKVPGLDPEDVERTVSVLRALERVDPRYDEELAALVELNADDPARLSDLLAAQLPLEHGERVRLLGEPEPMARFELLSRFLTNALERAQVGRAVEGKVRERIRRTFLREQLEVLRDELGEPAPHVLEVDHLADRIVATPLSPAAEHASLQELELLRRVDPSSPEAAHIRAHLAWLLDLPWGDTEEEAPDPERFERVLAALGEGHHGLADVKERVTEFLAVHELGGSARGNVLCFLGPPGTGKSSMARAVARALGRPFAAIPVGAMTEEPDLAGLSHRQEGGVPGAILSEIHRLGAGDPVLLLDELDKLSLGNEGNASGALLQILDPDQGAEFVDHYLGVPFDLSRCLFVATANETDSIPDALLDRMEVIEFAGYTDAEKVVIARDHLVPRAREAAGLADWQFKLTPAALRTVIRKYTEEAGVRHLARLLDSLARKAAVDVVRGGKGRFVRKADLAVLLGPSHVEEDLRMLEPTVGLATGLAWTSAGGALLPIEALAMPGDGGLILTGRVGDVMRESVQAALSFVRTRLEGMGLAQNLLSTLDIHIHFPTGGTPKDGPSAGIAVATAVISLLSRIPARHDVAMTGEMSLLGHVLPVGGIREKLLAAIRHGIPEVVVPRRNAEEVLRLPAEIRAQLTIHLVDDVLEAFGHGLAPRPTGDAPQERGSRSRDERSA